SVQDVRGAPRGYGQPIVTAPRGRCAPPDAREPRTFTDLRILPYNSASLTSGPKLRFRIALSRNARILVRVLRRGRVVASRSASVRASGGRRVALKGRIRRGSYRLTVRARSNADGAMRCDAQKLRVKRR
ncbi:MAG TPA: hypothetical protein VGV67_07860, partial [Solirubrobacteraceae bacterium]|nr:hypothetical protein [Solirubrobacteraceae bacterium]